MAMKAQQALKEGQTMNHTRLPGNRKRYFMKDNLYLLLLTLPAVLYFLIFHYAPMFGVVMAFKDFNYRAGILGSEWVGLKNFEYFFRSHDAWRVTRNTVGYSLLFIVVGTVAAVTVALLLYEIKNKLALKFYQTTMIFPTFLSWVLVSYIVYIFLNPTLGVFNQLSQWLGLEAIGWYAEPKYWPFILTVANVWKGVGLSSIIYYAALMGVDPELYEAARIDGANKWQMTWAISIPALTPIITILTILAIGDIFSGDFGLFYQIPRDVGMLYPVTDIIDTYVFRGLRTGDLSVTAAVGLFQALVGLVLIVIVNAIVRKIKPENALF